MSDFFSDMSDLTEARRAQLRGRQLLDTEMHDGSFSLRQRIVESELKTLNFNDPVVLLLDKILEVDKEYAVTKFKNRGGPTTRRMVELLELSLRYRAKLLDLVGASATDEVTAKVLDYARKKKA